MSTFDMRAAFVHIGSFSNLNSSLLGTLRQRLSYVDFVEVDATNFLNKSEALSLMGLVSATREYGVQVARYGRPLKSVPFATSRSFRRMSERLRWHLASFIKPDFVLQTQGLFDAKLPGVPHFIYTDHTGLANLRYPQGAGLPFMPSNAVIDLERSLYEGATRIFTTSHFATNSLDLDYAVGGKSQTVFAGPPIDLGAAGPRHSYDPPSILFVGSAWERKGGPDLLQAFKIVSRSVEGVTLDIVGCNPRETLPKHCQAWGRRSISEMREHYRGATIFCLPSRWEPSAGSYIEAAISGLPIVACLVGGTVDRVIDGQTGFVVDARDVSAISDRLFRLATSSDLRARFGRSGQTFARQRFSWPGVVDAMTPWLTAGGDG